MNFKLYQRYKFIAFPTLPASELVEYIVDLVFVGQVCPTDQPKLHKRTKMGNLKIVGWKMFYVGSFKIILRTFPPLNFWWE